MEAVDPLDNLVCIVCQDGGDEEHMLLCDGQTQDLLSCAIVTF